MGFNELKLNEIFLLVRKKMIHIVVKSKVLKYLDKTKDDDKRVEFLKNGEKMIKHY